MNQPFCSPVQALRSVLDAAALLPTLGTDDAPEDSPYGDGE